MSTILIELGDQALHLLWGAGVILLPWLAFGFQKTKFWYCIPAAALAAAVVQIPRELVDQWPVEDALDTALDLMSFGLGGALAALLTRYVGR